MAKAQSVSQAYLLGIREGRAMLRQFERDGLATIETIRRALDNSRECLALGFHGEARDAIKGERDFWSNQLARLQRERAIAPA